MTYKVTASSNLMPSGSQTNFTRNRLYRIARIGICCRDYCWYEAQCSLCSGTKRCSTKDCSPRGLSPATNVAVLGICYTVQMNKLVYWRFSTKSNPKWGDSYKLKSQPRGLASGSGRRHSSTDGRSGRKILDKHRLSSAVGILRLK